jgi:hypothetical protein
VLNKKPGKTGLLFLTHHQFIDSLYKFSRFADLSALAENGLIEQDFH